jgi:site-specific recombinase XerD
MSSSFEKLADSYLKSLEAAGKRHNTLRNYKSDLAMLGQFIRDHGLKVEALGGDELNEYAKWLENQGLRVNSRRRKIMTLKSFLRTMGAQVDLHTLAASAMIAPEKQEKAPRLVPDTLLAQIYKDLGQQDVHYRNRLILALLRETGMLVTELLALRSQDIRVLSAEKLSIKITGSRARSLILPGPSMSHESFEAYRTVLDANQKYLFHGYNRGGPNPDKMTPRGVEILFKLWANAYACPDLKPRALRHLFIVEQLQQGPDRSTSENRIMRLLGLRTNYSLKVYEAAVNLGRASGLFQSQLQEGVLPLAL